MNTVLGVPEPEYRRAWVSMLWMAMLKRGKGYRRSSLKRTGRPEFIPGEWNWKVDRRGDKPQREGP